MGFFCKKNMSNLNPEKIAQDVLSLYKVKGFPVFPEQIARKMGLGVHNHGFPPDISGALQKEKGKDAIIFINSNDSDQRKRFSIAHELGHYMSRVLTDGNDQEYEFIDFRNNVSKSGLDREEVFANKFAAELLMPEKEVKRLHKKGHNSISMADYFSVSPDAMSYRLDNLKLKRISYASLFG